MAWLRRRRPPALTDEQRAGWERDGYLHLEGFLSPAEVAAANAELDRLWRDRGTDDGGLVADVYVDTPDERRLRFADAPDDARGVPYKLNDTFLASPVYRELSVHPRLVPILAELLGGDVVACNGLNLERGSQQRFHFDTFFMPPAVPNMMVASWMAFEDCSLDAGPLRYYPGSHHIPPFRFSDGRLNISVDEMPQFDRFIEAQIAERRLEPAVLPARAGDVFVWHAQLYHGGAPITDRSLTRRSLVTHYFRRVDLPAEQVDEIGPGRFVQRRGHQPVPA